MWPVGLLFKPAGYLHFYRATPFCIRPVFSIFTVMTSSSLSLPSQKGSYLLLLHLLSGQTIRTGQLGIFPFPAGFYIYVGSARGPGGLRARIQHHLRPSPKPYWHIDYLRQCAEITGLFYHLSEESIEHQLAQELQNSSLLETVAPKFGASDCRCPTHLFYSDKEDVVNETISSLNFFQLAVTTFS